MTRGSHVAGNVVVGALADLFDPTDVRPNTAAATIAAVTNATRATVFGELPFRAAPPGGGGITGSGGPGGGTVPGGAVPSTGSAAAPEKDAPHLTHRGRQSSF